MTTQGKRPHDPARISVHRLPSGLSLVSAVSGLALDTEAAWWLECQGRVSALLCDPIETQRAGLSPRMLQGSWRVLSLQGRWLDGDLVEGFQLMGISELASTELRAMRVLDAQVDDVWLRCSAVDATPHAETDDDLRTEPSASLSPTPRALDASPASPWLQAAALSAQAMTGEVAPARRVSPKAGAQEPPKTAGPKVGDFLHHTTFGICRIDRLKEGEIAVVKTHSGIRKTLKLSVFKLGDAVPHQGRNLFRLSR